MQLCPKCGSKDSRATKGLWCCANPKCSFKCSTIHWEWIRAAIEAAEARRTYIGTFYSEDEPLLELAEETKYIKVVERENRKDMFKKGYDNWCRKPRTLVRGMNAPTCIKKNT